MTQEFLEIRGDRVLLRDPRPDDLEAMVRWQTVEIAWGEWDAPWDGVITPVRPEKMDEFRRATIERIAKPVTTPRTVLYIERIGGPLLGHVGHYHYNAANGTTMLGICINESAYWDQGLGTEAIGLFVDYLFTNTDLHRVGLDTWSGNHRMVRCAEKCGFLLEGRLREVREWRGQRYDSMKFGMLRREWEALRR